MAELKEMDNQKAIELLKGLYCKNKEHTKYDVENLVPVYGEKICQLALDENKAIRQAIQALENNRTSIEFKPFDFPSWEEFKTNHCCKFHQVIDRQVFEIYVGSEGIWTVPFDAKIFEERKLYSVDKQGYTQACQWLNTKKRELAEQIGVQCE